MYKLNPYASRNDGRIGTLSVAPKQLVSTFGQPQQQGYKVSGLYVFESEDGTVFTVYDYKYTNLYNRDLPTPEEFWNSDEITNFSIGGNDQMVDSDLKIANFIKWVKEQINVPFVQPGFYEVVFTKNSYSTGKVSVHANNYGEAKKLANDLLDNGEVEFGSSYDEDVDITSCIFKGEKE